MALDPESPTVVPPSRPCATGDGIGRQPVDMPDTITACDAELRKAVEKKLKAQEVRAYSTLVKAEEDIENLLARRSWLAKDEGRGVE